MSNFAEQLFEKTKLYDMLGVDAYEATEAVMERFNELSQELEELPEDERAQRMLAFQEGLKVIKNPNVRVALNSLILDKVDHNRTLSKLEVLQDDSDIDLPDVSFHQIIVDGESLDLAKRDFNELETVDELLINEDEVRTILTNKTEDRKINYES